MDLAVRQKAVDPITLHNVKTGQPVIAEAVFHSSSSKPPRDREAPTALSEATDSLPLFFVWNPLTFPNGIYSLQSRFLKEPAKLACQAPEPLKRKK
jgi:hypothetical protein